MEQVLTRDYSLEFISEVVAEKNRQVNHKIKILYFIDYLHGFGGTERHLFNLASRLNKERFDCTVCPFRFNKHTVAIFRNAGIKIEPAPFKRIYGWQAFKQAARLKKLIRARGFDFIQTFNVDSDFFGALLARIAKGPLVISSRRDMGVYRKNRHIRLSKFIHCYVDQFLAVCEAVADNMTVREAVKSDRITTVYNGFDMKTLQEINQQNATALRKTYKIDSGSFVIGNVSHLRPEKGHDIFFAAIRKVLPEIPELKVLLLGGSADLTVLEDYRHKIKEYGIQDVVFLSGYVENVLDYVSVMDICCLTPLSNEGFSNAILEQMAMGKPVIVSDVGGNREAIVHGETGLVVPVNDADAVAEAILKLYRDPVLRKKYGDQARNRVETQFSMDKMVERMETFYSSIYNKR